MSVLVAVDPSVRSSGLAIFRDGTLIAAASVKCQASGNLATRCLAMADEIVLAMPPTARMSIDVLAIEWSQVYRAQKSPGDPNDLAPMAGVDCAVAALLSPEEIVQYTPREWAGNLKKATKGDCKDSPRARRIASRLTGPELEVWNTLKRSDHDAIDAIGIGLKALGRFEPRRAIARG